VDVPALFDRYEWGYETVEAGIWRSSFADEQDEEFDLYVAAGEDWLHFAVTPLTPVPAPECREKLTSLLLRLNQTVRLVRFAIDGDGDVTLLADLPMAGLSFILFAATLDALIHYTRELGSMLARTATEPCFEYFLS
jgi:hypothetical protein